MYHAAFIQFAIKKISNIFEHATLTKRTLREIKLLRLLHHDNTLELVSIARPNNLDDFEDIYLISSLMDTDLASIIMSPQDFSDMHIQFFIYQVLRGLKFLHSANVIHRDLKPRNLLVNSNCDLRICDFGLARMDIPEMQWKVSSMSDYIATR